MGKVDNFIRSVCALPDYHLKVVMDTGAVILFDFRPRLHTARFGALQEDAVFQSVRTDGDYLLFRRGEMDCVRITAKEFMDLVLVDRTGK